MDRKKNEKENYGWRRKPPAPTRARTELVFYFAFCLHRATKKERNIVQIENIQFWLIKKIFKREKEKIKLKYFCS